MGNTAVTTKKFSGYMAMVYLAVINFSAFFLMGIYSAMMPLVMERLQVSATVLAMFNTVYMVVMFFSSFLAGKVYEKFGSKNCVIFYFVSALLWVISCLYAPNVIIIYGVSVIYGFGNAFGSRAAINKFVSEWFVDRRDEMIGYVTAIYMFGASAGLFVYSAAIQHMGGYAIAAISLGTVSIIALLCCVLLKTPRQLGQLPLGYAETGSAVEETGQIAEDGIEMSVVKKAPAFYLLIIASYIIGLAQAPATYMTVLLDGAGVPASVSSSMMGILMMSQCIISLVIGKALAKIKYSGYTAVVFVGFIGGLMLLRNSSAYADNTLMITLIVLLLGCACGASSLMGAFLVPHFFGMKSYGTIMPILAATLLFGNSTVALFITPIATADGSWDRATTYCIILMAIAAACVVASFILSPMKGKKVKNSREE